MTRLFINARGAYRKKTPQMRAVEAQLRQFVTEKKRKIKNRPEQELHIGIGQYLDLALPRGAFWFHCPNEGKRGKVEREKLAQMGVRRGFPDICIFHAGRSYGLEIKTEKTQLSIEQIATHAALRAAGMRIETVRSLKEAELRLQEFGLSLNAVVMDRRAA